MPFLMLECACTGVVCNGGAQARERATLARCLLDHVGAYDVPVGIGSAGDPSGARPHEYALPGYADVDQSRLLDGAQLLHSALRGAQRKSVRLLCISSLRDVADLLVRDHELVLSRVERVVIQGGLLRDEANGAWVGDSAVNNGFDQDAANMVYGACQQYRLPMTVVSRFAVPLLPMQVRCCAPRMSTAARSINPHRCRTHTHDNTTLLTCRVCTVLFSAGELVRASDGVPRDALPRGRAEPRSRRALVQALRRPASAAMHTSVVL